MKKKPEKMDELYKTTNAFGVVFISKDINGTIIHNPYGPAAYDLKGNKLYFLDGKLYNGIKTDEEWKSLVAKILLLK